MPTIIKDYEQSQKEQNAAQEAHGKVVARMLEAKEKWDEAIEAKGLTDTKQTTKEHLGKIHTEENKPDEMEADKVGKPNIGEIRKIEQTVGDKTVDIVQVPESAVDAGLALPAGDVPLTEVQRTGRLIDETFGISERAAKEAKEAEEHESKAKPKKKGGK